VKVSSIKSLHPLSYDFICKKFCSEIPDSVPFTLHSTEQRPPAENEFGIKMRSEADVFHLMVGRKKMAS
jgi:hypothetical protein